MENIVISKDGVEKLLECINPKNTYGPDHIPARLLKKMASPPVMAYIFEQSIDTGELLDILERGHCHSECRREAEVYQQITDRSR